MKMGRLWLLGVFFLAGCWSVPYTVIPKKNWEIERAKIEKEYNIKSETAIAAVEKAHKDKADKELANGQEASKLALGIFTISEIIPEAERTRPEVLTNLKSKELLTRLPDLTMSAVLEVNEELKKELNTQLTTVADLEAKYKAALEQSRKDKAELVDLSAKIVTARAELAKIDAAKSEALTALEVERAQRAEAAEAVALERAKEAENRENTIKMLIKIFVGIGVVCAVAAWGLKSVTLAGASAGAFAMSVSIPFLETWMIVTLGSIVIVIVVVGIGIKLYRAHKERDKQTHLADSLVGSIQEHKDTMTDTEFKAGLGAKVDDWIKDKPEFKPMIDDKLKKLNLK